MAISKFSKVTRVIHREKKLNIYRSLSLLLAVNHFSKYSLTDICNEEKNNREERIYLVAPLILFYIIHCSLITFSWKFSLYKFHRVIRKTSCRSKRSQMFFTVSFLKNFANFKGKHLCWSLFLIKLLAFRSATLLKRETNTEVFLWNWKNF